MTTSAKTLEEMIHRLSPHEREAVRNFVESLVVPAKGSATAPSLESLFGSWESGDENSADNERIDADLAREYLDPHEPAN
jgi:hypothetical protein